MSDEVSAITSQAGLINSHSVVTSAEKPELKHNQHLETATTPGTTPRGKQGKSKQISDNQASS